MISLVGKTVKKFQFNYCKNGYFSSITLLLAIKIKETYPLYIYILRELTLYILSIGKTTISGKLR